MLLLATSTDLAVPALSEPAYRVLIMSYAKDANFHMQSDLLGNGSGNDRDMRSERPHFAWRRQEEVRPGPEVPLGQVLITNGAIQGSVDERVRRYVRPLARPHVVEGTTEPGRTGWRLWREGDRTLALEVTVDTSEAGFTDIPAYFATLQSDFGIPVFFTDGPGFIVDERETSFTYRLPLHQSIALSAEVAAQPGWNPSLSAQRQPISDQEAEERGWTLYWIGFQAMTSYAPESDTRARQ
jgi:hypothetical protein